LNLAAAAGQNKATAFAGDVNCLAIGQTSVSSALHQDERELVPLDHDIENCSADAKRAGRCLDRVAAGLLDARNEAEGAFSRVDYDFAGAGLRVENIFVELDLGIRPDADAGLVFQQKLSITFGTGAYRLFGE
jgi:hypothetical protein